MSNFHPLEVVDRGSETQLQVGENLNKINSAGWGLLSLFSKGTLAELSPGWHYVRYCSERVEDSVNLMTWEQSDQKLCLCQLYMTLVRLTNNLSLSQNNYHPLCWTGHAVSHMWSDDPKNAGALGLCQVNDGPAS